MTGRSLTPRSVAGVRRHTGQPKPRPRPRRRPLRPRATLEQTLRNYRHLHGFGVDINPRPDIVVVDEQCRPVWPVSPHVLRTIANSAARLARHGGPAPIPDQRQPDAREVIRRASR